MGIVRLTLNSQTIPAWSVCWSGLHVPIPYSLLGGGVQVPEKQLCGTLDSVPIRFKNHYVCTRLRSPPDGVRVVIPPPRSAPLCSTGAACAQGRLLPHVPRGPVCCVGVCLGLRVRVRQLRLRRFFRFFRLLPGPLPVDPRLLPSPPGYPCAQPSF